MKTMNQIKTILTGAGVLFTSVLCAQEGAKDSTLTRTVVVENQYNPEVMDAFKVNVLPKVEEPAVAKQHIDYATAVRPLSGWQGEPIPVITYNAKQKSPYKGYVRAAYGNRNNTDVKLSYMWDITSRDQLNVMGTLYGMNGKIPYERLEEDWKSRFFRTDVSLDYKHEFNRVFMQLGGAFGSQVFNYVLPVLNEGGEPWTSDSQHFTLADVYAKVTSKDETLPVQFSLQTGFQSFKRKYAMPYFPGTTEGLVHTVGQIWGTLQEEHTVGIDFAMDNVFYNSDLKDYTLVQVNPYYKWNNEVIDLRLGAHVDAQTSNGSGIKFAPDVHFGYTFADTYKFYIQAIGGTTLSDFRRLNEMSPYWMSEEQIRSTHTPLDARLGVKGSPVAGFGFNLFGGYRIVKDELFSVYSLMEQAKAKTAYAGGRIGYTYKDWVNLDVEATYYNWNMNQETEPLLVLKPNYEFNVSARVKILPDLYASMKYCYEGRSQAGTLKKADPVNDLSLWADYRLFQRVDVFVRLNNLLNKNYVTEVGCPVQGFYAMGGLSFAF